MPCTPLGHQKTNKNPHPGDLALFVVKFQWFLSQNSENYCGPWDSYTQLSTAAFLAHDSCGTSVLWSSRYYYLMRPKVYYVTEGFSDRYLRALEDTLMTLVHSVNICWAPDQAPSTVLAINKTDKVWIVISMCYIGRRKTTISTIFWWK